MRVAAVAICSAFVLLTACGGPETSQANNAQANIGNEASPPATANGSAINGMAMLAAPLPKDQAAKVMHERHEGMETIGKTSKAIKRTLDGSSPDLAAVRAGIGISALSCFVAENYSDLVRVAPHKLASVADLWLLAHPDLVELPAVRAVIDFVTECARVDRAVLRG